MPQFTIVRIVAGQEPEPHKDGNGKPCVFENGADAACMALNLTTATGIKHQPRPIRANNGDWKVRETTRFDLDSYELPPWHAEPWAKCDATAEHFAHVSVKDRCKLAYTENADRKTRIESDWDLQHDETGRWDDREGTPRKYVRARGSVGSGGGLVRVRTVNGDITVRRADR